MIKTDTRPEGLPLDKDTHEQMLRIAARLARLVGKDDEVKDARHARYSISDSHPIHTSGTPAVINIAKVRDNGLTIETAEKSTGHDGDSVRIPNNAIDFDIVEGQLPRNSSASFKVGLDGNISAKRVWEGSGVTDFDAVTRTVTAGPDQKPKLETVGHTGYLLKEETIDDEVLVRSTLADTVRLAKEQILKAKS